MDIQEFKDKLPAFIEQAKDIGKHASKGKTILTPSLECIDKLDEVVAYLHNLWMKKLIDDNTAWNVSVALGVLLGEMIINERGFYWAIIDENLPVVQTEDHNQLSPITKLHKIIIDEDDCEGSASGFYEGFLALERHLSAADGNEENR